MVNPSVFRTLPTAPPATATNEAGGKAYELPPREKLVQLALTTTFNDGFYVTGSQQLENFRAAAAACEPEFVAKMAVYARKSGYMKDAPAALLAQLDSRRDDSSRALLGRAFDLVVDNGKTLRGFFNVVRSGAFGKKSFSQAARRLLRRRLLQSHPQWLLRASIGNKPSMRDILRAVRPAPKKGEAGEERRTLFAWLLGQDLQIHQLERLPGSVRAYAEFVKDQTKPIPDVPFQMIEGLPLSGKVWAQVARKQGWQWLRQNLNRLQSKNAFAEDPELIGWVADRLRDPEQIAKAKVMPYQLLATYQHVDEAVPHKVRDALHDAVTAATAGYTGFDGEVCVGVDVSSSMSHPVTGERKGATTKMRCVDVAGMIAATILAKNKEAKIVPFNDNHVPIKLEPRDSIVTNAARIAKLMAGGTAVSVPLVWAGVNMKKLDVLFIISDNESWADSWAGRPIVGTVTGELWLGLKRRNPGAKLVCWNLQAVGTTQIDVSRPDTLQVAGWSDLMLGVISSWIKGGSAVLPNSGNAATPSVQQLVKDVMAVQLPDLVAAAAPLVTAEPAPEAPEAEDSAEETSSEDVPQV